MTVEDLIDDLGEYNKHAKVSVIAHNREFEFSLSYGGGDGCPADKAKTVSFYVDKLNTIDAQRECAECKHADYCSPVRMGNHTCQFEPL